MENNTTEKISVVIVSHNRSHIIEDTLKSLVNQSELPAEVIIVDDASTDDTVAVVRKFDFRGIPVKIIEHSKNAGGPAQPFNAGIARASGTLIALLEDDDVWDRNKLALSRKAFEMFPEAGMAYADYRSFENEAPVLPDAAAVKEVTPRLIPADEAVKTAMERQFALSPSNMVFRKSCWKRAGGFLENFKICTDYTFLARLLCTGCRVVHIPAALFHYRVHQGSQYFSSDYIIRNYEKCWTLDFLFRSFPGSMDPRIRSELGLRIYDMAVKSAKRGKIFRAAYFYCWSLRHNVSPLKAFRAIGDELLRTWRALLGRQKK